MHTFSISSLHTNYTYTILVYVPTEPAPEGGFPVTYVLDGLSYFQYLRDTVRLQSRNVLKTGVERGIVVGICHDEPSMHTRRFYDFTAPANEYLYPERMASRIPKHVGGAADFQRFLEEELKPTVEEKFPINRNKQTLFGHSLGGYYVLWNLFNHASYTNYIALSPSVWWNNHELFNMSKQFMLQPKQEYKLFIGVGEHEGDMVEDAHEIYKQLQQSKLILDFYVVPDENHASVVPTVMSRAVRFVN